MNFDKVVKDRRSVRRYKDTKVSMEKLNKILDSARFAPSAGNLQNWRFVVIENEKKKKELAKAAYGQNFVEHAPIVIVVCNEPEEVVRFYGKRGKFYATQNCAAVVEHILLKATDLGLGSCWVGAFDEDEVVNILKITDDIKPEAIITIGYSEEDYEMPTRYDLNNLVYFEEYGNKKK